MHICVHMAQYAHLRTYGSLCTSMYIGLNMYICMHMAQYVHLCTYGSICTSVHTWLTMYICVHMAQYVHHLCTYASIYTSAYIFLNLDICVYMAQYVHSLLDLCIYSEIWASSLGADINAFSHNFKFRPKFANRSICIRICKQNWYSLGGVARLSFENVKFV